MVESYFIRGAASLIIMTMLGCSGLAGFIEDHHVHPSRFNYIGPARSVCIAGDFNQWARDTHCLSEQDGRWTIWLMLPHGTHRYAFIVNGRRWVADPKALYYETDSFGRKNSVAVIN